MNTAAFFRRLPGDPARHSLECRIFNVIMLAASAAGLIATIYNLLIDNNFYQVSSTAFGTLFGLLLYGYSYRTGLYQGASLLLSCSLWF